MVDYSYEIIQTFSVTSYLLVTLEPLFLQQLMRTMFFSEPDQDTRIPISASLLSLTRTNSPDRRGTSSSCYKPTSTQSHHYTRQFWKNCNDSFSHTFHSLLNFPNDVCVCLALLLKLLLSSSTPCPSYIN